MAAFIDAQGNTQQLEVGMEHIRAAADNRMSVRDYVNVTFPTNTQAYGDTFSQLCASEGIVLMPNREAGVMPRSLDATLNGTTYQAGSVVTNPNNQARVLLMPAVLSLVEDQLVGNLGTSAFDAMVGSDVVVDGDWALWPVANYSGPESARSQVTSQLAKPASMLTLTTSEQQVRIATKSLGVEWSDQAARYLNLDFIALSVARQVAVERNEVALDSLKAMLNGDADVGQGALSSIPGKVKNAKTDFDSTLSVAGTLSQKAWMSFLSMNSNKRTVEFVVTDIAGAMAIEGRSGRPTNSTDNPNSPRIDTLSSVLNPGWGKEVKVFIMPASAGWPANTIMAVAKPGIMRLTSTGASFNAIESFAIRRATAMRFDYGSIARRMYDDAFDVLTLTV